MRGLTSVLALVVVFAAAPAVAGQAVCVREKPRPDCRAWWVFEPFVGSVSNQTGDAFTGPGADPRASDAYGGFEIGVMGNISARHAAGGSVVGVIGGMESYGVRGRYRYWMSPRWGLDVSPGLLWERHEGLTRVELNAGVMAHGWVGGFVGINRHLDRERWESTLGLRLGGVPGLVATLVGVVGSYVIYNGLSQL